MTWLRLSVVVPDWLNLSMSSSLHEQTELEGSSSLVVEFMEGQIQSPSLLVQQKLLGTQEMYVFQYEAITVNVLTKTALLSPNRKQCTSACGLLRPHFVARLDPPSAAWVKCLYAKYFLGKVKIPWSSPQIKDSPEECRV